MLKQIKIEGVEQNDTQYGKKVIIFSGKEKYIFYDKVKSGAQSKAYEQFKRFRFGVDDTVAAEVEETPKSFKDNDGKEINYTERKIKYFQVVDEIPVVEKKVEPKVSETTQILARLTNLEAWRTKIDGKLNDLENEGKIPF